MIFLGFEIGQRWPEAVMHSWGSYFVPVPKRAEELRFGVKNELRVKYLDKNHTITISVGVAVFPVNGSNSKDLLIASDTALYRAKNAGRNQVVIAEIIK